MPKPIDTEVPAWVPRWLLQLTDELNTRYGYSEKDRVHWLKEFQKLCIAKGITHSESKVINEVASILAGMFTSNEDETRMLELESTMLTWCSILKFSAESRDRAILREHVRSAVESMREVVERRKPVSYEVRVAQLQHVRETVARLDPFTKRPVPKRTEGTSLNDWVKALQEESEWIRNTAEEVAEMVLDIPSEDSSSQPLLAPTATVMTYLGTHACHIMKHMHDAMVEALSEVGMAFKERDEDRQAVRDFLSGDMGDFDLVRLVKHADQWPSGN